MGFGMALYPFAIVSAEGARGMGESIGGRCGAQCRVLCRGLRGAEWILDPGWDVAVPGNRRAAIRARELTHAG